MLLAHLLQEIFLGMYDEEQDAVKVRKEAEARFLKHGNSWRSKVDTDTATDRSPDATSGSTTNNGRKRHRKSAYTGVFWYARSNKWCASLQTDGTSKHLGYFVKESDAGKAYADAKANRAARLAKSKPPSSSTRPGPATQRAAKRAKAGVGSSKSTAPQHKQPKSNLVERPSPAAIKAKVTGKLQAQEQPARNAEHAHQTRQKTGVATQPEATGSIKPALADTAAAVPTASSQKQARRTFSPRCSTEPTLHFDAADTAADSKCHLCPAAGASFRQYSAKRVPLCTTCGVNYLPYACPDPAATNKTCTSCRREKSATVYWYKGRDGLALCSMCGQRYHAFNHMCPCGYVFKKSELKTMTACPMCTSPVDFDKMITKGDSDALPASPAPARRAGDPQETTINIMAGSRVWARWSASKGPQLTTTPHEDASHFPALVTNKTLSAGVRATAAQHVSISWFGTDERSMTIASSLLDFDEHYESIMSGMPDKLKDEDFMYAINACQQYSKNAAARPKRASKQGEMNVGRQFPTAGRLGASGKTDTSSTTQTKTTLDQHVPRSRRTAAHAGVPETASATAATLTAAVTVAPGIGTPFGWNPAQDGSGHTAAKVPWQILGKTEATQRKFSKTCTKCQAVKMFFTDKRHNYCGKCKLAHKRWEPDVGQVGASSAASKLGGGPPPPAESPTGTARVQADPKALVAAAEPVSGATALKPGVSGKQPRGAGIFPKTCKRCNNAKVFNTDAALNQCDRCQEAHHLWHPPMASVLQAAAKQVKRCNICKQCMLLQTDKAENWCAQCERVHTEWLEAVPAEKDLISACSVAPSAAHAGAPSSSKTTQMHPPSAAPTYSPATASAAYSPTVAPLSAPEMQLTASLQTFMTKQIANLNFFMQQQAPVANAIAPAPAAGTATATSPLSQNTATGGAHGAHPAALGAATVPATKLQAIDGPVAAPAGAADPSPLAAEVASNLVSNAASLGNARPAETSSKCYLMPRVAPALQCGAATALTTGASVGFPSTFNATQQPGLRAIHLQPARAILAGDRVAIILEPDQALPLLCRGIVMQRCRQVDCYCNGSSFNVWTDSFGIVCIGLNDSVVKLAGELQERKVDWLQDHRRLPTQQQCEETNTWFPINIQLSKCGTGYQAQYQYCAQRKVPTSGTADFSAKEEEYQYTAVTDPEPILLRAKDNYDWERVRDQHGKVYQFQKRTGNVEVFFGNQELAALTQFPDYSEAMSTFAAAKKWARQRTANHSRPSGGSTPPT